MVSTFETMSRAEISVSAGYFIVGLIVIQPFTDIVSAPGWLDIGGNCDHPEMTSVQGFSNK